MNTHTDQDLNHWGEQFTAYITTEAMTFEQFMAMPPHRRASLVRLFQQVAAIRPRVEPDPDTVELHGEHLMQRTKHHVGLHTPDGFRRLRQEGLWP